MEDMRIWHLTENGVLTTTSFYTCLKGEEGRTTGEEMDFGKIWKAIIPNKLKFYLWTLHHERIQTNHFLHSRGLNINPLCGVCEYHGEDIDHLLF